MLYGYANSPKRPTISEGPKTPPQFPSHLLCENVTNEHMKVKIDRVIRANSVDRQSSGHTQLQIRIYISRGSYMSGI